MERTGKAVLRIVTVAVLAVVISVLAVPAAAAEKPAKVPVDVPTAQAVLYEVTENMYLLNADGQVILDPTRELPVKRNAVAALFGWARVGTALCPSETLVTNPRAQTCTITADGKDSLSLATFQGSVDGTFAVVIQDDNAADAPEFVVLNGAFTGAMDLSTRPLGVVAGSFTASNGATERFCGVVRLPFNIDKKGKRDLQVKRGAAAFYLANDGATLIPVHGRELSLGMPTVRFELNFGSRCGS
jgi:hypothetical protein